MPTTDYKRDERLQVIHKCLLNTNKNWSVKKLLEKVNNYLEDNNSKTVSARTIADDLKYLELKKFAPLIPIKRGRAVFYTYEEDFELNRPIINSDESFSLVMANQILKQLKGFILSNDLHKITQKLQHQIDEIDENQIIFFEEQPELKNIHYLQDLFECIRAKTVLKIHYQNFHADTTVEKIIHPYLLKQYNQRWFLFGYDEVNKRIDNSPLDRIVNFKPTNLEYNFDRKIDVKNWFDNIVGVSKYADDKPQKIVFKISKERASYIKTKPIHHSQKAIKNLKNGDLLIELFIIINKELISYILSFGKDIEILKPNFLCEEIKKMK